MTTHDKQHPLTSREDHVGDVDPTKFLRSDRTWQRIPLVGVVTLLQSGAGETWFNMPAALTEFDSISHTRTKLDLTGAVDSRVVVRKGAAAVATAKIKVQYSSDESTWADLCEVSLSITVDVTHVGAWTVVPSGAKADVFVRIVGIDGDGAADPTFGLITLQVR